MHRLLLLPAFALTLNAFTAVASGQSLAATSVVASPTTVTVGGSVSLAATVQTHGSPGAGKTVVGPTGTITFLDGTTPLGIAPIVLVPNGLATNTFAQVFGTPDPTFTPQPNIEIRGLYKGELLGDLNGDGALDLLLYDSGSPFSTQAFTSNGKGGYTTGTVQMLNYLAGCSPSGYVVGAPGLVDLNGDGKIDILCGTSVAYGNGDGTFAQPVTVSFLSSGYETAYAADINGDGKVDVLAVPTIDSSQIGSSVQYASSIFLNQGGGTFASAGTFPVAPISYLEGVGYFPPIVLDLNNDGKPDILSQTLTFGFTQEDNPQRSVDVLLNNGDGTFGTYMPITLSTPPNNGGGPEPYVMGSGDVNGDGKADLILTETDTSGNVDAIVLLGNGDGTFQPQTNLILSEGPVPGLPANAPPSISVEDLNSDGKQDLIFGNGQVALGNGDGTFALSTALFAYPQGSTPAWVFPVVQMTLPGNSVPSLVYVLPAATPPATSVFTPQPSSSGALSLATLAVGTHAITAQYSGDANYTADSSAAIPVMVNEAASTTALTSSANPSFAGQSVTLSAQIVSSGPAPTGNVTFSAGPAALGTVALTAGVATYTTTAFTTVGAQTITVSYSGDGNTQASSTTLSQVVNAPLAVAPGSNSSTTLTVKAGQTVTAPISVSGASGFSGQVSFTCSGLPAMASCTFNPATVAVSGTTAVSTEISINTKASTTTSKLGAPAGFGFVARSVGLASLLLLWPLRRRDGRIWAVLALSLAAGSTGLMGCGGGDNSAKAAPGSYPFMVTASSGSVQIQTPYTLAVQ